MKAVRLYDIRDLRVEEVAELSAPPPGFVNLEVRAAGICGSDLHNSVPANGSRDGPRRQAMNSAVA